MKVKTSIKAGGVELNHSETLVRDAAKAKAKGLNVKTSIKAGGTSVNHNETLVLTSRG
jgi:hypothetical protein